MMATEDDYIVLTALTGPVWCGWEKPRCIGFNMHMAVELVETARTAESRQKLAMRILEEIEEGIRYNQRLVNGYRAERGEPPHEFDYPIKKEEQQ
jgi:hypothetical protein